MGSEPHHRRGGAAGRRVALNESGPYQIQAAIAALHAARAALLKDESRIDEARAAYEQAIELTSAEPERVFLELRLGELGRQ